MKTYWQKDKYVEEEGNKRTIKDYTYHFFPDFFKPTMIEYGLFILGVPLLSVGCGGLGNIISKGNIPITIVSTLSPQILTYTLFRGLEIYSMVSKKGKILIGSRITDSKHKFSYKPKTTTETIDDVVED